MNLELMKRLVKETGSERSKSIGDYIRDYADTILLGSVIFTAASIALIIHSQRIVLYSNALTDSLLGGILQFA